MTGCGERTPASTLAPRASASASSADAEPFAAGRWGDFSSKRFEMRLPLPDGHGWKIDDHGDPWLAATHAASGSELVVRVWGVPGVATRARCEEDARMRRKLPGTTAAESEPVAKGGREHAELVERRTIDAPAGFDTVVEAGVTAPEPPRGAGAAATGNVALRGFVVAFGGRKHRCFAYAFTTSATGPGASQIVGDRLATMEQGSLAKVALEEELAPKLGREPGPGR